MPAIAEGPVRKEIREVCVPSHAMTLDEFLVAYEGADDHIELVKGVPTKRMAARYEHEKLFGWLYILIGNYLEIHDLGIVLGSRSAVRIGDHDGRLPDLLFVRKERVGMIQSLVLPEPPDLVIELVSRGDPPSHRIELESDYTQIGVPEIVFVDTGRHTIHILRKRGVGYDRIDVKHGRITLESIPGLWLDADWLLTEERPSVRQALDSIENSI